MKTCSKCEVPKELDEFGPRKRSKDGKAGQCLRCVKDYQRKYHKDNSEVIKKNVQAYRDTNKGKILAQRKVFREDNKEKIASQRKEHYSKNKDKILAKDKERREANVDVFKARSKDYYERNKETIKAKVKAYGIANRETIKSTSKRYRDANKDKASAYSKSYREENKESLKEHRDSNRRGPAGKYYLDKLGVEDKALLVKGELTTLCKFCRTRFVPTLGAVIDRMRAYNAVGAVRGEANLYCSSKCGDDCGTKNQIKYPKGFKPHPRELQGWWAEMIKERDGYECQKCGSKEDLHAHHIEPLVKTYDSWTEDNGLTFCVDCHYGYAHKLPGCTLAELKNAC